MTFLQPHELFMSRTLLRFKLQKVNTRRKRNMMETIYTVTLAFMFCLIFSTKTIRQLDLVVYEQIVDSGFTLVDYICS